MAPQDWGGTPLANATVRGIIAAIIIGILAGIYGWQNGMPLDQSVLAGVVPILTGFLSLLGFGIADQNRASQGIVNPADVPVQIAANTNVFGDMAPGTARDAGSIARSWSAKAKSSGGR